MEPTFRSLRVRNPDESHESSHFTCSLRARETPGGRRSLTPASAGGGVWRSCSRHPVPLRDHIEGTEDFSISVPNLTGVFSISRDQYCVDYFKML